MIYNSELNIYSDTDSNNSREIKVLQDAVNVLEHQVEELETDVSGLSTEVDTAKVKAVNGEITSLTVANETVNKITATGDANFATLNATDLNASVDATLANATVMGDLRVNGVINGTLAEYNIEDLEVENLKAEYVEMNGNINMNNHSLGSAAKLGTKELVVNGNALFNDSVTTQKGSLNWGKVGIESETGEEVIALYTDGLVKAIDIEAETLDLSSNAEIGGNLTVGGNSKSGTSEIGLLKSSSRVRRSSTYITIPTHSTGDDNFIEIKPFNGTYYLVLEKNGNDILSIRIDETSTNNGTVISNIEWSADDRAYLKKIELLEDGRLFFRTFGDGKLYYVVDTSDSLPKPPETYYAVRPTESEVVDDVDVLFLIGSVTVSSDEHQGGQGGSSSETQVVPYSFIGEKFLLEKGFVSGTPIYTGLSDYAEVIGVNDTNTDMTNAFFYTNGVHYVSGITTFLKNKNDSTSYQYIPKLVGYNDNTKLLYSPSDVILAQILPSAYNRDTLRVIAKGLTNISAIQKLSSGVWYPTGVDKISYYGEQRIAAHQEYNTLNYMVVPKSQIGGGYTSLQVLLDLAIRFREEVTDLIATDREQALSNENAIRAAFYANFYIKVTGSGEFESEEEESGVLHWTEDTTFMSPYEEKDFGVIPGYDVHSVSTSYIYPFIIQIEEDKNAYYKFKELRDEGYVEEVYSHIKTPTISYWTAK